MTGPILICSGEPERRGGRHEDHLSASPSRLRLALSHPRELKHAGRRFVRRDLVAGSKADETEG